MTSLRNRNSLALIGIVLVTLVMWWPSVQGGFLYWDDNHNIVFNERVHSLNAENLKWMFFDVGPDIRYKPLGWLAWGMVATVFGVDPFGFHLANLFLHLVNTVLVFLLLKRICLLVKPDKSPDARDRLPLLAAAGSLLWALHPMRVEPVAWISCLPHHLCLAFILGATLAYLNLDFSKSVWRQRGYWIGALLFGYALLVFPLPLGYPAVWLALNVFPLKRIRLDSPATILDKESWRVWTEVAVLIVIAVGFLALQLHFRYVTQGGFDPPKTLAQFPLEERAMQGMYVWAFYLWRLVFPVYLAPVYMDLIPVEPTGLKFVASAVILTVLIGVIIARRRQMPAAAAVMIAHLGILVPVLGLTEKPHFPGDRYAIIDGVILTAGIIGWLWCGARDWRRWTMVGIVVLGLMVARGQAYLPVWRDDVAMFRTQAQQIPDPYRSTALMRLGWALHNQGEYAEAEIWLQLRSRGLTPEKMPFDLAMVRGLNSEGLGRPMEAIKFYRGALAQSPNRYFVMYRLGRALFETGEIEEGREQFEFAIQIAPADLAVPLEYARALRSNGLEADAQTLLEKTLATGTGDPNLQAQIRQELQRMQDK